MEVVTVGRRSRAHSQEYGSGRPGGVLDGAPESTSSRTVVGSDQRPARRVEDGRPQHRQTPTDHRDGANTGVCIEDGVPIRLPARLLQDFSPLEALLERTIGQTADQVVPCVSTRDGLDTNRAELPGAYDGHARMLFINRAAIKVSRIAAGLLGTRRLGLVQRQGTADASTLEQAFRDLVSAGRHPRGVRATTPTEPNHLNPQSAAVAPTVAHVSPCWRQPFVQVPVNVRPSEIVLEPRPCALPSRNSPS